MTLHPLARLSLLFSFLAGSALAGPYASEMWFASPLVSFPSQTIGIHYNVNYQADLAEMRISPAAGGAPVATFAVANNPGQHFIQWNGRVDNAAGALVPPGQYRMAIRCVSSGSGTWQMVRSNSTVGGTGQIKTLPGSWPSTSVTVDLNPNNPRFGQIFVGISEGPSNFPHGVLICHPDLNPADLSQLFVDLPWVGTSESELAPWGVDVADDGEIWAAGTVLGNVGVELGRGLPDGNGEVNVGGANALVDNPRDVLITGTGAGRVLRWTQGTLDEGALLRANIGNSQTLSGVSVVTEVNASFGQGFFGRALAMDDGGNLYLLARVSQSTGFSFLFRFNAATLATGPFPLNVSQAVWTVAISDQTSLSACGVAIDHRNRADVNDDIVYVLLPKSSGGGSEAGIYRAGLSGNATRVLTLGAGEKIVDFSAEIISDTRADITCDWAGNIVFSDPFNEMMRIYAPPGATDIITPGPVSQVLTVSSVPPPSADQIRDHILGITLLTGDSLAAANLYPDAKIDAADLVRRLNM